MHRNINVERLNHQTSTYNYHLNKTISLFFPCQVPLVSPALKVKMVDLVLQVSMELLVDQENLADREHQVCPGKRARQVVTESLDQLGSKESQVGQHLPMKSLPFLCVEYPVFRHVSYVNWFDFRTSWLWWPWPIWTSRVAR